MYLCVLYIEFFKPRPEIDLIGCYSIAYSQWYESGSSFNPTTHKWIKKNSKKKVDTTKTKNQRAPTTISISKPKQRYKMVGSIWSVLLFFFTSLFSVEHNFLLCCSNIFNRVRSKNKNHKIYCQRKSNDKKKMYDKIHRKKKKYFFALRESR